MDIKEIVDLLNNYEILFMFDFYLNRERQRQVRKWQQQQRGRQNYKPMLVTRIVHVKPSKNKVI